MNHGRHVFLQQAAERKVATLDQRAEASSALGGFVTEASYFTIGGARPLRETVRATTASAPAAAPTGFLGWFRGLFAEAHAPPASVPRTPEHPGLQWVTPFDDLGHDALALCADAVDALDGYDDPVGSVRRITGTVVCLEPRREGDSVVLRDLWVDRAPVVRLVELIDFCVQPDNGPPVAVCCAMAPLVIARPDSVRAREALAPLSPRAREWLEPLLKAHGDAGAACLRIEEGARVEVTGVVGEPNRSAARFDIRGRSAPFRGGSWGVQLLVGDEPGTRLVIRALGA